MKVRRFALATASGSGRDAEVGQAPAAALTEKQIRRGVHRSTRELEEAIRRYIEIPNRHPQPFIWTKTADEILASVARFCKRISDSGH